MEELLCRAAKDSSVITRSFWLGKFLQLLPELSNEQCQLSRVEEYHHVDRSTQSLHGKPLHVHTQQALECLKECETSLSPNVFRLIVRSIADLSLEDDNQSSSVHNNVTSLVGESVLDKTQCTLNWASVSKWFGEDVLSERKYYSKGARRCAEVSKQLYSELMRNSESLLLLQKQENFEWTQTPQLFSECVLELQQTERCLRKHTGLLLGTAALERALGDVYLTFSQARQCPLLLRDLLATPELDSVFGKTAMCLLCCLIGPPSGLNLRNVLWHGFAAHTEIPAEYVFLLFVVVSSLGHTLRTVHPTTTIHHKPYLTFSQEQHLTGVFKEFSDDELSVVEKLFSESFLILPSMLPTWRGALEAFKMKRFSYFMVLMLPSLEHSLRRVFACVNGCPERNLTAESTTLYTTFDEILSPLLSSGEENKLKGEIGVSKLEMLLDILVHPEGPRVRDRISHGEVDFNSISRTLSNHVLCIAVLFCMKYSLSSSLLEAPPLARCAAVELKYTSIFHPFSLLRKELEQLLTELSKWKEIPTPDCRDSQNDKKEPRASSSDVADDYAALTLQVLQCYHSIPAQVDLSTKKVDEIKLMEIVAHVWNRPLDTLYVARHVLELAGTMRRTVDNSHKAVSQIKETALLRHRQYMEKQLRSRQRNNYDHLLLSLQCYHCAMVLLISSVLVAVASHFQYKTPDTQKRAVKFQKKLLQFSENFFSQSCPSRNRWEEMDKLCSSLAELVRKQTTVLAENQQ